MKEFSSKNLFKTRRLSCCLFEDVSHFRCLSYECSLLFIVTLFGMGDHSFPCNIRPRYHFFWKYIPNFSLTKVSLRGRYADSFLLLSAMYIYVFFVVVLSPGYLQAEEHQAQHTFKTVNSPGLGFIRWMAEYHWGSELTAQVTFFKLDLRVSSMKVVGDF